MKQEESQTQGKELKEQSSSSWSGGVKEEVEANPFSDESCWQRRDR
jgi:hypothetical protein